MQTVKVEILVILVHAFGVESACSSSTKRFNFHLPHATRAHTHNCQHTLATPLDTHRIFMLAAMDIAHESTGTTADIGIPDNALLGYLVRAQASDTLRCWAERAVGIPKLVLPHHNPPPFPTFPMCFNLSSPHPPFPIRLIQWSLHMLNKNLSFSPEAPRSRCWPMCSTLMMIFGTIVAPWRPAEHCHTIRLSIARFMGNKNSNKNKLHTHTRTFTDRYRIISP